MAESRLARQPSWAAYRPCINSAPSAPPPLVLVTGAATSWTAAVTTPLSITALMPLTGAATTLGGFAQVPLLPPLGMTQVRPPQHVVRPTVAVVQPMAPKDLQSVDSSLGRCASVSWVLQGLKLAWRWCL